jgi:glycosyltransferase involved in cell wall biosynthesis
MSNLFLLKHANMLGERNNPEPTKSGKETKRRREQSAETGLLSTEELRVLLVAYRFPPQSGVGALRPAKLARFWQKRGIPLSIVAGPGESQRFQDSTLGNFLPAGSKRVAADLSPFYWLEQLRRSASRHRATRFLNRPLAALQRGTYLLSVPDERSGWLLPAFLEGTGAIRRFEPSVIVASGPPWSSFVVAAMLSRSSGIPLVLDYRDPWTATYINQPAAWLARSMNPRFEQWVISEATAVVAAQRAILSRLRDSFPDLRPRYFWVPNGYDPADFEPGLTPNPDLFTLSYMGSLFSRRSPKSLVDALEELLEEKVLEPGKFVFQVGGSTRLLSRLCRPDGLLQACIREEGYQPHRLSVRAIQQATVNLVMEGDMGGPNVTTPAKFYEALYSGRPVLLLSPEGVTTRLASCMGGCWVSHPEDKTAIKDLVIDLYRSWQRGDLVAFTRPAHLRFYDREYQAERLLKFVQTVCRHPLRSQRPR